MPEIELYIEAINGGSQFSEEYSGILWINGIVAVLFMYFLFSSAWGYFKEIQMEEKVETPLAFLVFAILFEMGQIMCEFIHNYVYSWNGQGVWFVEMIETVLEIGAESMIISLVLLLAMGWTFSFSNILDKDTYLMIGGIGFGAKIFIGFLTYLDKGESHSYHDFSGWPGFIIVMIRLLIFGFFIMQCSKTQNTLSKKQATFFKKMKVSGTIYILGFPFLYFISPLLHDIARHRLFEFGHYLIQIIAIMILKNQLTSKSSTYAKTSQKSEGILPTQPMGGMGR